MTAMTNELVIVDVQNALSENESLGADELPTDELPSVATFSQWANVAYSHVASSLTEVTIRLVEESEMAELNETYRGKKGTTNVLSFAFENECELNTEQVTHDELGGRDLLGDIVICHKVIQKEAAQQGKTISNHYAHMVTHGVLHLCGYDHLDDAEADEMEALEVQILAKSQLQNPYT